MSVWPGRRRVPGIVAPDSWGARGADCLPRDVLRHSSSVISTCDGTTVRRCLCPRTGSGTTEARPPESSAPPATNGGQGCCCATRPIPGRIFGADLFTWKLKWKLMSDRLMHGKIELTSSLPLRERNAHSINQDVLPTTNVVCEGETLTHFRGQRDRPFSALQRAIGSVGLTRTCCYVQ